MAHDDLQAASDAIKDASAAATTEDGRERLYSQSDKVAKWATQEKGPDHGQVARVERILESVSEDENEAVADHVATAKEHLHKYREGVEGV